MQSIKQARDLVEGDYIRGREGNWVRVLEVVTNDRRTVRVNGEPRTVGDNLTVRVADPMSPSGEAGQIVDADHEGPVATEEAATMADVPIPGVTDEDGQPVTYLHAAKNLSREQYEELLTRAAEGELN